MEQPEQGADGTVGTAILPIPIDIKGITSELLLPYKIAGGVYVASVAAIACLLAAGVVAFIVDVARRRR